EALVELVEVLYRRPSPENTEEAMKWVAIGERERIFPAKIAFLKGLILQQQGKNEEAIASFEQAKAIEPNLGQTVDLQVGMALLKEQKLEQAKVRLQTAIQQSPETDLAGFARQYLDVVEKRIEIEKPLRITLGLFQQYDTNVISKPLDPAAASQAAPGISTSGSAVTATSVRVNYLPKLNGPWLMNAQYAFYANFHDDFATSQDLVNNSLSLTPGYSFGDSSLNLRLDYSNALVRDPSHKQYTDTYTFGPLYRHLIGKAHLLEIFAGYGITEYAKPALDEDEDRDSEGLRGSLSWIWLFRPGAFCNLRYDYDRAATDGRNWDKEGHSYTVNLAYPVFDGVSFQVSGQLYEEDYDHVHSTFLVERDDEKYQGSMGLTWEFMKNASLIGQYTATRQHSNIDIYDYRREAYTAGLEYRF
ncbi:MAG TPA: outer membrane beta-barrel protein, partial [Desulfurivibrionaceae bacterium]|nr:outer membrane beta-barrel protein [Desulfurivibrionaceae bacterium]